jgi:hypothetical protein
MELLIQTLIFSRGNKVMKKKGKIPSILFGGFILVFILILALALLWGDEIREIIKDGFTDDENVSVLI